MRYRTTHVLTMATLFMGGLLALSPAAFAASISQAEAIEAAEEYYDGDGTQTGVEIETEDGVTQYEVEFTEEDGAQVDVSVDAETGRILGIESDETENDDNEDTEDANDDEPTIDASDTPIDTNVTQNEALTIAERVLGSSVSLESPSLNTEEDGQIMWLIPYETNDGDMNEIVINTVTGAYRLVLEDDSNDFTETTSTTDSDDADTNVIDEDNETSTISTTTTVSAAVGTPTTIAVQEQIIQLLQQILSLLRTQLSQ